MRTYFGASMGVLVAVGLSAVFANILPIPVLANVALVVLAIGVAAFVGMLWAWGHGESRLARRWGFAWLLCIAVVIASWWFAPYFPDAD